MRFHGAVGYIPPAGWTVRNSNGVTVLAAPGDSLQHPCTILLLPPMPKQRNLAVQGEQVANAMFAAKNGPYREAEWGRDDVMGSRYEGTSATGWNYVDLWGRLGTKFVFVRTLIAEMGDSQVLPVLGVTDGIDCMGAGVWRDSDVWALLFHSLQMPGHTSETDELKRLLIGAWSSTSGSAGNSDTFAPNGRFGAVSVVQTYQHSATPGMVWEVNRSWSGDGPYEVHGDRLRTQNPRASVAEHDVTRLFSIVRRPTRDHRGQFDYILRVVRHSDTGRVAGFSPNGNYVLTQTKQR
jgi:hypothetical protein